MQKWMVGGLRPTDLRLVGLICPRLAYTIKLQSASLCSHRVERRGSQTWTLVQARGYIMDDLPCWVSRPPLKGEEVV